MTTNDSNKYNLTRAEIVTGVTIGGGLLAVSIAQGASYFWAWGETTVEHMYLVGMVVGVLLGSQMLIRQGILNWKKGHTKIATGCVLIVCIAEFLSFMTTQAAVQGRAANTIRSENHSSPEYRQAMKQVNNYPLRQQM